MSSDREALHEAGGVRFRDTHIEDMTRAAAHYCRVHHLKHVEDAFFNGKNVRDQLGSIAKWAGKLEAALKRTDPDGYAAADMSGGIYHVETIEVLHATAKQAFERAKIAVEFERSEGPPDLRDARESLARETARCWHEAGGEGRGDKINSWGDREEYGPVIRLILELLDQSGLKHLPTAKTLQTDLKKLPNYSEIP